MKRLTNTAKLWSGWMLLLVFAISAGLAFFLYSCNNQYTHNDMQAVNGVWDGTEVSFNNTQVHYLREGWLYYDDVLLTPETYAQTDPSEAIVINIGEYSSFGFGDATRGPYGSGTYVLTLELPEETAQYALDLPEIYSSYTLYVNDRMITQMGNPNPTQYAESVQSRLVSFTGAGTTQILIAVTNKFFLHSGMLSAPALGSLWALNNARGVQLFIHTFVSILMLMFCVVVFLFCRKTQAKYRVVWLLFWLCACIFLHSLDNILHMLLALPVRPWCIIQYHLSWLGILLIVLLHNNICQTSRLWSRLSTAFISSICILQILYSTSLLQLPYGDSALYQTTYRLFLLLVSGYLICSAAYAIHQKRKIILPLLCGDFFYASMLLWRVLLPDFEPIYGRSFTHWGELCMMGVFSYVLFSSSIRQYRHTTLLAHEQRSIQKQLQIQQAHFQEMTQSISQSRRLHHDFRQHLRAIANLADQPQALHAYIDQITALHEQSHPVRHSNIPALDALLFYYTSAAQKQGVPMQVQVELPAEIGIAEISYCTIVGNLLENALEACQLQQDGEKHIRLHIKWQFRKIYTLVENSFDGVISMQDAAFLSRKHAGKGLGTASMQALAQELGGTVDFHASANQFRAVVILPPVGGRAQAPVKSEK